AIIGEDGLCYIDIDDIFGETVNTNVEYHVYYGKCGKGDIYTKEKHPNFFIVEGTPGLRFSWELKAKREGYENNRLEEPCTIGDIETLNIDKLLEDELKNEDVKALEEIINEELNFKLEDYILERGV